MNAFVNAMLAQSRTVVLLFALVAIAGAVALFNLPSGVYPELAFPRIIVIAELGMMSPERIVLSATRILEEAAAQVWSVRWIRSKTIRGSVELSVEFQPGTDMNFALQQLQSRIAETRSSLPNDANLIVERVTPAIDPMLSYNLTSDKLTQADLYNIAQYQMEPALTRVKGVSRVQVQGGDIPQIIVEVDPQKLKDTHLSMSQVGDVLKKTNQLLVVGRLTRHYQQNLVVATGDAVTPEDLGKLVLNTTAPVSAAAPSFSPSQPGTNASVVTPIYLADIAKIYRGYQDRTSFINTRGRRSVVLNIYGQPDANVLEVSDGISNEIKALKPALPVGIDISAGYDQAALVRESMENVRDAIVTGVILIIVVLFLFLHDWRATLIAALSIPLCALAAFGILWLLHQSLNLMSLGGLAVAIGLVIDDAIVIIENVDRQLRRGLATVPAVAVALNELVGPVTSSTATTLVVFLPLGLLSGVAGQFFTSLTITLAAAVVFSLILALTLTPMLAAQWLVVGDNRTEHVATRKLDAAYASALHSVLARPAIIGLASIVLVAGGILMFDKLGTDFLPNVDEGSLVLDYLSPPGTAVEETNNLGHQLDEIIAGIPEVRTWTRRAGTEMGLFATEPNKGDNLIVLKAHRHRSIFQIIDSLRLKVRRDLPQLDCDFHQVLQDQINDLSGAESPVVVKIFGDNPNVLSHLADTVQHRIANVPGLVDINNLAKNSAPEIDVHVNPTYAGRLGLAPADVADQVQAAMLGTVVLQMPEGGHLVDVRERFPDNVRFRSRQLSQIPIFGTAGNCLPLSAVATTVEANGQRAIYRENQQRYVSIEGELGSRDLGSVVRDIQNRLAGLQTPVGYRISMAGLYKSQQEAFSQLISVLLLGCMLVYVLLVFQFRSLLQPLAIFSAVPLALFGVVFMLFITGTALNVSSLMGIVMLIGLVVKNGIILLDWTNRLRADGLGMVEALIEAGTVRLRPILMTTLCCLLGLLPLAVGFGTAAELQKPLALAVIGGLSLSTVFTLLFVPVIYRALESWPAQRRRYLSTGPQLQ